MFPRALLRTTRSAASSSLASLRIHTPRIVSPISGGTSWTARSASTLSSNNLSSAHGGAAAASNSPSGSPTAKRQKLHTSTASSATISNANMTGAIQQGQGEGPNGWKESVQDYGAYKLLQSFPIKYAPVGVGKWKSEKTGLTVVVGSHEGESGGALTIRHEGHELIM